MVLNRTIRLLSTKADLRMNYSKNEITQNVERSFADLCPTKNRVLRHVQSSTAYCLITMNTCVYLVVSSYVNLQLRQDSFNFKFPFSSINS